MQKCKHPLAFNNLHCKKHFEEGLELNKFMKTLLVESVSTEYYIRYKELSSNNAICVN
ncbi:hypothetical protein RABR111495_12760 [Rahnella bruchi]